MVIVRLLGGLGNQLFQYAAGRAVAFRNDVPMRLETASLARYRLRKYRLNHFNIVASIASLEEMAPYILAARRRMQARVCSHPPDGLPYYQRPILREQQLYRFDPNILNVSGNVYLIGYWQSEK